MKSAPMMTAAEELTLIARWREGDQRALDRLILEHQPLVISAVRPYRNFSTEDLIQEGNVGLMLAAQKFDASKGFRFNTYARWWIKAAITEYTYANRGAITVPRGKRSLPPNKPLSYTPLEKHIGHKTNDPNALTYADILPADEPSPEEVAIQASEDRRVRASMQKLQERTRYVIEQRMDGAKLKDIGVVLGVCHERVRQIEARAMRLLKADLTMPRRVEGRA